MNRRARRNSTPHRWSIDFGEKKCKSKLIVQKIVISTNSTRTGYLYVIKKWTIRKCRETDLGMVTVPYICIFILRLFPKIGNNSNRKKQVQNPDYTPRNAEGRIWAPSSVNLRVAPRWEPPHTEQGEDNGSKSTRKLSFLPALGLSLHFQVPSQPQQQGTKR